MDRELVCSRTKGGRRALPEGVRDLSIWAGVDPQLLDESRRKRFDRLSLAIQMYCAGEKVKKATAVAGVSSRQFYRLLDRCVSANRDGRINGFRALAGMAAPARRVRTSPLVAGRGMSGAFGMLLRQHPSVREALVKTLLKRAAAGRQPNTITTAHLVGVFLKACTEAGVGSDQYPFNTKRKGASALMHWVRTDFREEYAAPHVRAKFGASAANQFGYGRGDGDAARTLPPYGRWQVDAHKVDVHSKLEVRNVFGDVDYLPVGRFTILLVRDVGSGALLAMRVVFAKEIRAEDVLMVLFQALTGASDGGQEDAMLESGAAWPAAALPLLRFATPIQIELDNALAHLANLVQYVIQVVLDASIDFGAPRSPHDRAEIEADFRQIASRLCHQLPGTTGSGHRDAKRELGSVPLQKRVSASMLKDALVAYVKNRNVTSVAAAGHRTPLANLKAQIESGALQPRYLPEHYRHAEFFSRPVAVKVKMDLKSGRAPFVYFMYCRYGGGCLVDRIQLVGKRLYARVNYEDLRSILLFSESGEELGRVTALGRWGQFPHDIRIRRMFLKLKEEGALGPRPEARGLELLLGASRTSKSKHGLRAQYAFDYFDRHWEELDDSLAATVSEERSTQAAADKLSIVALPTRNEPHRVEEVSNGLTLVPRGPLMTGQGAAAPAAASRKVFFR